MATGPESVKEIAEATGLLFVTVDTVARALKQHKPPLWARSVQGGGRRSEQTGAPHLVNIAVALAVADPFTHAPQAVAFWRSFAKTSQFPMPPLSDAERLLLGALGGGETDLGGSLERLVELAADADEETLGILTAAVQVELIPHPLVPCAIIHVLHPDLWAASTNKPATKIVFRPCERPQDADFLPPDAPAPIIRSATLTMHLFAVLGQLLANSRQRLTENETASAKDAL